MPQLQVLPAGVPDAAWRAETTALGLPLTRRGKDGIRAARGSAPLALRTGLDIPALAAREHAGTAAGDVTRVPGPEGGPGQIYLVGIGDGSPGDLRTAAASLARAVRHSTLLITSLGASGRAEAAQAVAEGLLLGSYRTPREGVSKPPPAPTPRVLLAGGHDQDAVRRGVAAAGATLLARDLANTPSSTKGPSWLAARARREATAAGLAVQVWDEAALRRDGFGGLLAVGGAAARGPRLVRLDYRPSAAAAATRSAAGARAGHVVLAGKGITFDTGGISLKQRDAMLPMKTDMTGAAVVLGVLLACRELGVPVRVTGLLAIAENSIGGGSYRPGDVVRTYDGTTVEVRNTDAEGRMVLADALGYARLRLQPDVMIDVATLTGAATQSLGRGLGALYSTSPGLRDGLVAAGLASGERFWPMPLVADYRSLIDSDIADVCQITNEPASGAGSIIAALMLREFAGDVPWAHLDIAGPARSERDRGVTSRGGTGWGARALLAWLATR